MTLLFTLIAAIAAHTAGIIVGYRIRTREENNT